MSICHQGTNTHTVNNIELFVFQTNDDLGVIVGQDSRYVDAETFVTLYTVFVCPKLEYWIQAASIKRDNEQQEHVQRIPTKLINGITKLPYDDRLAKFMSHVI